MIQRLARVALITATVVLWTAAPALADPAEPTNYRSIVGRLDPAPTGVTVEIVGGDAFLSVAAAEGHTVLVPGYFGEPYLRIDADGGVFLNTKSPARYINQDRFAITTIPESADAEANPEWEQIGSDGRFAWHDHRVHWMSRDLPPTVAGDRSQIVFPWTITIFIDGVETEVSGELFWFPSTNPAGPILTGILGILPFLAWRPGRMRPVALAAVAVGALMLFVAITQFAATPGFDRGFPVAAVFPAISIAAGLTALWMARPSMRSWALVVVSGAALLWWSVGISAALTKPVLPSQLPAGFERSAVSLAAWIGVGIAAVGAFELLRSARTVAPTADV